jgi:D-xylose transport system permease protein
MTMQEDPTPSAVSVPDSGANALAPTAAAVTGGAGFAADAGATNFSGAVRDYIARLRGGDVGALPALLGVIVLVIIFTAANNIFLTRGNLANLVDQAGSTALIAMGLLFVLLLGEIDLSAGTASGVAAGALALALNHNGNLHSALGGGVFLIMLLMMLAALVIAALSRLWPAVASTAIGVIVLVTPLGKYQIFAIVLAVTIGTAIGVLTGTLVARVGIPSFVVTLALFIAWQGVLLQFIGQGNALPTASFKLINGLDNKNIKPWLGWLVFVVVIGLYGAYTVTRSIRRRKAGLASEPLSVVLVRLGVLAIIGLVVLVLLNQERGANPKIVSVKGIPYVALIVLVLMVFWTFILTRTSFGRHLYAVGGNVEAARRAGINIPRMRLAAFAISSSMASLGGILLASQLGGVNTDAGGGNTLLYAVGAAVIGGTSLFGGRGRPRDAVIGALVIAIIPNGLGLLGTNSSYEFIITGLVLLAAASVDALSRRRGTSVVR